MSLFRGKTTVNRAEKIADFTVATAEYGSAVPEILGTTRTSGNIIYYDDFTAHEHKETQRSGKGGGSKTVTITYTYTVAIIFALCEGPVASLGKVWKNKDIFNYPSDEIGMTLYYGTDTQQPWPYVVGKHPEKALPYTGLAYMAGVIDLGSNASLPNFNFEVKGKLTGTGDGVDVNPADYILYILDKIGMGDVKISGIENYRRYCAAADLLISTPMDETKARNAREIVNEIATLTNAYIFWSNDQFKIVPLADRAVGRWEPNKTIMYDLTPDDFLLQSGGACVTYARKDSTEIYNRFTVEFINRANGYEKESVSYVDSDDLKEYGLRQASTTKAHYIYTKKRAVYIAEEMARKNKYERNKYTFKLDWAFCRLEVGDLVTLTDPSIGLDKQVALIDSVTEDEKGLLTFTAISRAGGDYTAAIYDVHDTDRPYVDFSPEPGDVDTPVIFQPPTELTSNGNELWAGVKGKDKNWGGCNVWVSDDNQHYTEVGTITNSSRLGYLAAAVSATATEIEVAVNGTLLSGTTQDAERANTLCWLDGECLSYTTATMLQNGNYQLSGIIRGQYNTTATTHAAGAKFARCDETLLKSPLKKEDVGKKLWIKFTSYNVFGAREQSLADVEPYEYTVLPYYIPPVLSVAAHNRYRELQDGVSRYDIVVDWTPPDFANYLQGDVWYKTSNGQSDEIILAEGIAGDKLGYNGVWTYGSSGKNQVVIPQAVVGDSYLIAVCTKDEYGVSTSPDMSPQTEILVALKTTTPNTPDGFGITFGAATIVSWQEVTNSDIAFYEVRLDENPGEETAALLARTNGLSTSIQLLTRSGTLYLYAKSAAGKYSAPAILKYQKTKPRQPKPPVLSPKLGGMSIKCEPVPKDCAGVRFYINRDSVYSVNNTISYICDAGVYNVTCAYVDIFGEGPVSERSGCTVEIAIDGEMIKADTITYEKMSKTAKEAISNASVDKINIAVAGILGHGSALVMDEGKYALVAANGAKLTGLFASADGTVRLQGDYIHITGKTLFDDDIITKKMLQAGSVSAEKFAAEEINLSGALAIVGGAVRLDQQGLTCFMNNSEKTVFNAQGITFYDSNSQPYSQIRRMCIGAADHGQIVTFKTPWPSTPNVLCIPTELQVNEANYAQSNVFQVCRAINVSEKGFEVQCFTKLGAGSSSSVPLNRSVSSGALRDGEYVDFALDNIPSTATQINVSCTMESMTYGRYTGDKSHHVIEKGRYKFQILNNGSVLAESPYCPYPEENTGEKVTLNTTYTVSTSAPAGLSSVTIRFVLSAYSRRTTTYYALKGMINFVGFNTSTEYAISTGRAVFIALDGETAEYTLK